MATKTKDAFIISSFNDAGTNKRFTAGKIVPIEEGSFLNYEAAGLVRVATADDRKAPAANAAA